MPPGVVRQRLPTKRKGPPTDGAPQPGAEGARQKRPRVAALRQPPQRQAEEFVANLGSISVAAALKGRSLVQQWRSAVGRSNLNKHLALPEGGVPFPRFFQARACH